MITRILVFTIMAGILLTTIVSLRQGFIRSEYDLLKMDRELQEFMKNPYQEM